MLNDPPNLRGADLLRRKPKVARPVRSNYAVGCSYYETPQGRVAGFFSGYSVAVLV